MITLGFLEKKYEDLSVEFRTKTKQVLDKGETLINNKADFLQSVELLRTTLVQIKMLDDFSPSVLDRRASTSELEELTALLKPTEDMLNRNSVMDLNLERSLELVASLIEEIKQR